MNYVELANPQARQDYYYQYGYVVYPQLIESALCDKLIRCFWREVKPYRGYLYRQATANPEKHVFTSAGYMLNSLLNPVSINDRRFPKFREISQQLLTSDSLYSAVEELMQERAAIVQTMYFEGNPATWPHQDCYYLDSDREGAMIAAWIALEDIHEKAGRFYIVPGSHKIEMERHGADLDIAFNHERYKALVREIIHKSSLQLKAPGLKQGDVLFWGSRTIHGTFSPTDGSFPRNSYTAHFIPVSTNLLQYQRIRRQLPTTVINGHRICLPKDQARLRNRVMLAMESTFPRLLQGIKKLAIKCKLR